VYISILNTGTAHLVGDVDDSGRCNVFPCMNSSI